MKSRSVCEEVGESAIPRGAKVEAAGRAREPKPGPEDPGAVRARVAAQECNRSTKWAMCPRGRRRYESRAY